MGGVETYFRDLVGALQEVDARNRYYLICHEKYGGSFALSSAGFDFYPNRYAKPSPLWYLRNAVKETVRFDILRPLMNRIQVDLVHHPFSLLNPMGLKAPSVLTFHDMQHEFFPDYFPPHELKARRARFRPSAEQADRIIAISGHVKTSLVERYRIPPDKIDVVHNCCGPQFRVIRDAAPLESARSRYLLDRPFIYYPAASWPHKNHRMLLAALRLLKDRFRFDGRLVLTGIAKHTHGDLVREIARLGLQEDVVHPGYVPCQDLPAFYNLARLMVFPSLYEGFGIPLAEAMACGCPIACSDAAAIPEVAGEAALSFDARSLEQMTESIWRLWTDDALRADLAAKGLERSRLFDRAHMARATVAVYEKAARR